MFPHWNASSCKITGTSLKTQLGSLKWSIKKYRVYSDACHVFFLPFWSYFYSWIKKAYMLNFILNIPIFFGLYCRHWLNYKWRWATSPRLLVTFWQLLCSYRKYKKKKRCFFVLEEGPLAYFVPPNVCGQTSTAICRNVFCSILKITAPSPSSEGKWKKTKYAVHKYSWSLTAPRFSWLYAFLLTTCHTLGNTHPLLHAEPPSSSVLYRYKLNPTVSHGSNIKTAFPTSQCLPQLFQEKEKATKSQQDQC